MRLLSDESADSTTFPSEIQCCAWCCVVLSGLAPMVSVDLQELRERRRGVEGLVTNGGNLRAWRSEVAEDHVI